MPGSKIEKSYLESPALPEAEIGSTVHVIRITEEGEMTDGMLPFCQSNGIEPGRTLTIISRQADGIVLPGQRRQGCEHPSRICRSNPLGSLERPASGIPLERHAHTAGTAASADQFRTFDLDHLDTGFVQCFV